MAYRLHASCDCCERASVGCDGFSNGLVVDEVPFAAADDEFGLAENLEMVRDQLLGWGLYASSIRRNVTGSTG